MACHEISAWTVLYDMNTGVNWFFLIKSVYLGKSFISYNSYLYKYTAIW